MADIVERLRDETRIVGSNLRHAAADEIERLRAIMDKLAVTEDGVQMVPGMRVWHTEPDPLYDRRKPRFMGGIFARKPLQIPCAPLMLCESIVQLSAECIPMPMLHGRIYPWHEFYSTRERAEAAAKAAQQKEP